MSKYVYTTVYEEFTGLKPPEPKETKPRRKRGYGHPYRMRLNIKDHQAIPDKSPLLNDNIKTQQQQAPASVFHTVAHDSLIFMDKTVQHLPKITYKKRRHYSQPG
ncbi:hypothetical protein CI610_02250 [invertebrate metagenome]|uniref:Uncharacterized protein n=1 Tax=invertebrate metagenome TaxID=1711999 RepID=A0A2H9T6G3_9ZZZZ